MNYNARSSVLTGLGTSRLRAICAFGTLAVSLLIVAQRPASATPLTPADVFNAVSSGVITPQVEQVLVAAGLPPVGSCASIGLSGTPFVTGVNARVMDVDGYPRTYIVYVPASPRCPAPVVFMFHGSSGDGNQFLNHSGWRQKADAEGIVAVFPTGLKYCKPTRSGGRRWVTKWNAYNLADDPEFDFTQKPPYYPAAAPFPADDVTFTRSMMDDVSDAANGLSVDLQRIYASGFSNGASFTARIALEVCDRLAAVAYVACGLQPSSTPYVVPSEHIPVWTALGTNDDGVMESVGWDPATQGELPLDPAQFLALPGMLDNIAIQLDAFGHVYDPLTLGPYSVTQWPNATLFEWVGAPRQIYRKTLLGGLGHHYPHGPHPMNPLGWVATTAFWPFFEQNSRP